MVGTNLEGADLSGASLVGTNLEGADLSGANLKGADLEGAKLPASYWIEKYNLKKEIQEYKINQTKKVINKKT